MFKCHVCGNLTSTESLVSEVFTVEGRRVLVEDIPAVVCDRCGEAVFSAETAERIRVFIRDEKQPHHTIPLEVYALR